MNALPHLLLAALTALPAHAITEQEYQELLRCRISFLYVRPDDTPLEELKRRYREVRRLVPELVPHIDGLRLVSMSDWMAARRDPHLAYGEPTFKAWSKAVELVKGLPADTPVTPDLLKRIHGLAMQGNYYRGYERRRIEAAVAAKKLDPKEGAALIARLEAGQEVEFSGDDHSKFGGRYRTDPVDTFVHNGNYLLPDGTWYFYPWELDRYRQNPYLTIDEKSLEYLPNGAVVGAVRMPAPADIPRYVNRIFRELHEGLAAAKDDDTRIALIERFQIDLMTVHPFIDGNGRSIRLLADFLFQRYGLPPPMHFHGAEYELTPREASLHAKHHMAAYVMMLEDFARVRAKRPSK